MRHTRIVCTLGPSSVEVPTLRKLFAAGMDVARLNFSHGDEATHRAAVSAVRQVAKETGRYVALLQDLQGPKIRTGSLSEPLVRLARGREVTLTSRNVRGDERTIPVSHQEIIDAAQPGDRVLLADGQIELKVRAPHSNGQVGCSVIRGGLLGERKGVAIPGRTLTLPALTDKDRQDMALGAELQFDYVAISFVRSAADVKACRDEQERLGWKVPVVAKLEKLQAIRNLRASRDTTSLNGILAQLDSWLPTVRRMRPEQPWGDVVRVLNRDTPLPWTVERLRRTAQPRRGEAGADLHALDRVEIQGPGNRRNPDVRRRERASVGACDEIHLPGPRLVGHEMRCQRRRLGQAGVAAARTGRHDLGPRRGRRVGDLDEVRDRSGRHRRLGEVRTAADRKAEHGKGEK